MLTHGLVLQVQSKTHYLLFLKTYFFLNLRKPISGGFYYYLFISSPSLTSQHLDLNTDIFIYCHGC